MLSTQKIPYEFLVRCDEDGIKGAHVQWLYVTKDGDKVVATQISQAEKVAILDSEDFGVPLADVLSPILLEQQKAIDLHDEKIVEKDAEIEQLKAKLAEIEAELKQLKEAPAAEE